MSININIIDVTFPSQRYQYNVSLSLGPVKLNSVMRNFVNKYCDLKRENILIYDTYQISMMCVISVNSVKNLKVRYFVFSITIC